MDGYRKLPIITDTKGFKTSFLDMLGKGFPAQPVYKARAQGQDADIYNEAWFTDTISEKVAQHPGNALEYPFAGERIFDEPIVGFVRGDDPIFEEFKKIIGPQHFTPYEIMAWQAARNYLPPPEPGDISVVSFILPISEKTRQENAAQKEHPSGRWAQTRRSGELFSQTMVFEMVTHLMGQGILAVAPDMTPLFRYKRYPEKGWASRWSHRHIAYAAGLGTFGMHDLLITQKGAAHRCGSFVVALKLEPQRERQADIHAYCLEYQGIPCLKCMQRCPAGAISRDGHDKEGCYKRVIRSTPLCAKEYHICIYGCGLCSAGVPCEHAVPRPLTY